MPLTWVRGQNPYRYNYFAVLEVGAYASARLVAEQRANLTRTIRGGGEHRVGTQVVDEAAVAEAEARLLDPAGRIGERLLVHPPPTADEARLAELCRALLDAAVVESSSGHRPLTNLPALVPLVPRLDAADIPLPAAGELGLPDPDSLEDLAADVQFDL